MNAMHFHILSAAMAWAGCYLVLCRIDKMLKGVTRAAVFVQHAVLGACLFVAGGLELWPEAHGFSTGVAAFGVLMFFLMSSSRWRGGAPDGTAKRAVEPPSTLAEDQLRGVVGGGK